MKYKLYRKDFEMVKNTIAFLPSIYLVIDDIMYMRKNFAIVFHFLVWHGRLLFMEDKGVIA